MPESGILSFLKRSTVLPFQPLKFLIRSDLGASCSDRIKKFKGTPRAPFFLLFIGRSSQLWPLALVFHLLLFHQHPTPFLSLLRILLKPTYFRSTNHCAKFFKNSICFWILNILVYCTSYCISLNQFITAIGYASSSKQLLAVHLAALKHLVFKPLFSNDSMHWYTNRLDLVFFINLICSSFFSVTPTSFLASKSVAINHTHPFSIGQASSRLITTKFLLSKPLSLRLNSYSRSTPSLLVKPLGFSTLLIPSILLASDASAPIIASSISTIIRHQASGTSLPLVFRLRHKHHCYLWPIRDALSGVSYH